MGQARAAGNNPPAWRRRVGEKTGFCRAPIRPSHDRRHPPIRRTGSGREGLGRILLEWLGAATREATLFAAIGFLIGG
ncbi:hypothetical protein, partial [Sphingomonas sp. 66-10]|uniref:hypothetical protein n=1 Tax=Sphingomonas sp. 66-10 TaxID=1895848 RepID=UPI00257D3974